MHSRTVNHTCQKTKKQQSVIPIKDKGDRD
jgi:hypothetical protein